LAPERTDGPAAPFGEDLPFAQIALSASDADGDAVQFTASSSDPDTIAAEVHGSVLALTRLAGDAGTVTITVTAHDGKGRMDVQAFACHVTDSALYGTVWQDSDADRTAYEQSAGLAGEYYGYWPVSFPMSPVAGLTGLYWREVVSGLEFYGIPDFRQIDAQVNFPVMTTLENFNGIPGLTENFSVRWTGSVHIDVAGVYTFWTNSDDDSWLYVDGVEVVDNGGHHTMQWSSPGYIDLSAGFHSIDVLFNQRDGWKGVELYWAPPGDSQALVPASVLYHHVPEYVPAFPDYESLAPTVAREDSQVDFAGGFGGPLDAGQGVAARWTGNVHIDTPGLYTFECVTPGDTRLYIDGEMLFDTTLPWQIPSGTVELSAGYHRLRLEYFDCGQAPGLELQYAGPGIDMQVIPADVLSHDTAVRYEPGLDGWEVICTSGDSTFTDLNGDYVLVVPGSHPFLSVSSPTPAGWVQTFPAGMELQTFTVGVDLTSDAHNTHLPALGDVDSDGDLDLVAGNYGQANRLYLNDGSGAFAAGSDITSDAHATISVALGDVDGDGDLDLVAGNYNQTNRLYLNNGTSNPFAGVMGSDITSDAHHTWSVALGDVDGDGSLDLVVGNYAGQANRLYLNNGTASPFADVAGSDITADAQWTFSVVLGDVDGDGDLDLVAGNGGQGNRLYLSNGTTDPFAGVIGSNITADAYDTRSLALGDMDGDGDLDLVVGNGGQGNRLYLNNGTADPFAGVTGSDITSDVHDTTSVALGDVNGDGDLDLVAGNGNQPNRLYLNNGTASPFAGVTGTDITSDVHDTTSAALGDVDGDGDLDLVAGNYNQANRLYLNSRMPDLVAPSRLGVGFDFGFLKQLVAGHDAAAQEGDELGFTAEVAPGITIDSYLWQVTADNGQVVPDGTAGTFSFTPADPGIYHVALTATTSAALGRALVNLCWKARATRR
ncbi:MAG: hypothetical protein AMJ81_14390, partial [Phycisphaerae bacterium SM23_33]